MAASRFPEGEAARAAKAISDSTTGFANREKGEKKMTGKKRNDNGKTEVPCDCAAFMADASQEEDGCDCSTMMSRMSTVIQDCDCAEMMQRYIGKEGRERK
jgi:hypothetical protein